MEKKLTTQPVMPTSVGLRLDKFLSLETGLSRARIANLMKQGHITPQFDLDFKVILGQTFTLTIPDVEETKVQAQNISLDIVYEDEDLVVINKPAGMVVHPGAGNFSDTMVNALLAHCGDSLSGIGGVKRPGIVHRIDKETSGLLVVAKNDEAHQFLSQQFAVHSIERVYQAIVYGFPPISGTIRGNIGRSPFNRQKMAIVENSGKPAITHYQVIKPLFAGKACLIECQLETGRTHQIRVHMTSIKHPLVGDKLYGNPPKGTPEILRLFPRQALHAQRLGFIHPKTKEILRFSAPIPDDMQLLIQASDVW